MTPTPDAKTRSDRQIAEDIPYGVRIAAAWSWRVGLILVMIGILVWLLGKVSFLIIPVMVASLLAGLLYPVVVWLRKRKVPNGLAVAITVLGFIGLISGSLALVGRQLVSGFGELWQEALAGIQQIQTWLADGPLHLTADQIDQYIADAANALQNNSSSILSGALSFGSTAGHFAAGLVLALFILIFFLLEGQRIWAFLVRLLPKKARAATDGAGRRGWTSMVNYVRIQMFVAFVDAVGIGVGAAIIQVPLALPLAVLVFIGSFIPVVGALVTGAIAVLLALVANGPVNALIMLAIVLLVQQLESHILQPLVMGKAVALHPVAVILTVAAGSYLAGIPGALFAVPILAVVNTAVRYIAGRSWEHDGGPGAVGAPTAEGSPGPDGDSNLKDAELPVGQSRGATGTESKARASGSIPEERPGADTTKGE
ncbi:AI-2E family transporter [Paenarthrobacter ureafaciens]|jgi:predicted PurR-regulated permease PerM|uniref:AI-2E family transporter n=1 Tax=Paenarthrobacter ureafaciens TaxID=37931 RepID=A0AAX3ELE0_PAEUR|nr:MULTISPECIES: AI-2E family transporter [Paenarthrobacter]AMB39750.1 permease [Arthrobacter sp. ATCC 21022]NKR10961.1 AI-2E family transporter [Arthrobacter sp. M5]NKR17418.1 AI-2E family transporter [Arthrobacter sp. M6]OEH63965.1 AI-2E family transporter [Arthrobacter sp. D4]OEH64722.1 AI-2E family transporter [Arthrobacter sp. D2]BCW83455.1 AI-2E family transporter [Arthrobacter sp. NicSoilE8]